jgi:hypothetical protein
MITCHGSQRCEIKAYLWFYTVEWIFVDGATDLIFLVNETKVTGIETLEQIVCRSCCSAQLYQGLSSIFFLIFVSGMPFIH